jgi:hypothetical protein
MRQTQEARPGRASLRRRGQRGGRLRGVRSGSGGAPARRARRVGTLWDGTPKAGPAIPSGHIAPSDGKEIRVKLFPPRERKPKTG